MTFSVALAALPAMSVEDVSCEGVATLGAAKLSQDSPPISVVIEVRQQVQGFRDPAQFRDRAAQWGRSAAALQDAEKLGCFYRPSGKASGDTEEVIPVRDDQLGVDLISRDTVQCAVVSGSFCAPEPGRADVGKAGAELVSDETEKSKNLVGVPGSVSHQLRGLESCLLFQESVEDVKAVAESAGYDDGVEASELVGKEVEVGDASRTPVTITRAAWFLSSAYPPENAQWPMSPQLHIPVEIKNVDRVVWGRHDR